MSIKGAQPEHRRITPHLIVPDTDEAVEFYRRAFGAEVLYLAPLPNGKHLHGHLRIANTVVMLTQEDPQNPTGEAAARVGTPERLGGTTVILELYVDDVDVYVERAKKAGATEPLAVSDAFWGDRYGWVRDPYGYIWALATVKEELTPKQIEDRMMAAFSGASGAHCSD